MKVEKPRKPKPPARDGSLPRPFFEVETRVLLDEAKVLSDTIKVKQKDLEPFLDERGEMLLELERRDVSYRAMARHIGITAPSVLRIVKRRKRTEPIA